MLKDSSEDQELSNMKVRNYDTAESVAQSLRNNHEESAKVSSFPLDLGSRLCPVDSLEPTSIKEAGNFFLVHKVTQSSPSPAMCFVAKVPQDEQESHIVAFSSEDGSRKLDDESTSSRTIGVRDVHIENGTLYMTTLIIPKQESASNSCQATNEEEVFKILNERSLYPVGWIHTHPSQSCFMSSVDLHTQYSYQVIDRSIIYYSLPFFFHVKGFLCSITSHPDMNVIHVHNILSCESN
ncbi:uncharacterized protein [Arachis hypogaea]|uniref:uncharacterized protein isoform X7 n=1 Tax=Arachis hypogaea TaxID=3818 RepID=UPI000DED2F29|nr:AMSH-like ubiquitin thioesterase 2 isoform X6 [Arachis hypogaea]